VSDETRNKLISALRQFRHNNDNTGPIASPEQGFVFAYDRDETEGLVASLEKKLEQAEARCAERGKRLDNLTEALVSHIEWESQQPQMKAWLLRKKAEAVEHSATIFPGRDFTDIRCDLHNEASRLRQQATEIERGAS
jgi:uncharacterized coiled-coil protein SlyX